MGNSACCDHQLNPLFLTFKAAHMITDWHMLGISYTVLMLGLNDSLFSSFKSCGQAPDIILQDADSRTKAGKRESCFQDHELPETFNNARAPVIVIHATHSGCCCGYTRSSASSLGNNSVSQHCFQAWHQGKGTI